VDAIVNAVIHLSSSDPVTHESVVGNVRNLLADESLSNDAVTEEDLVDAVEIVPSGIGEVARLQSEEDYAYFEA